MRRKVGNWSWKETTLAAWGVLLLAGGVWVGAGSSPLPEESEGLAARGAAVFRRERCGFCHTVAGSSNAVTPDFTHSGPDLRQPGRQHPEDWNLAHLIQPDAVVAGSTMPSFAHLSPEDLQAVVAFLQTLSTSAPPPGTPEPMPAAEFSLQTYRQGRDLFDANCAGCHGEGGKGNGVVGHLLQPEPRDLTDAAWLAKQSDARLFEVISDGVPETAMPGYRDSLSPKERRFLVCYLRAFGDPSARQFLEQGFFVAQPLAGGQCRS